MPKNPTTALVSEANHRKRYYVAAALIITFIAAIWANLNFSPPFVPIFTTLLAFFALIELISICGHLRLSSQAIVVAALQTLIIVCATFAVWLIELSFENWILIMLAVLIPVFTQSIFAYFIGRFWLPRIKHNQSTLVRFLRWYNFRSSSRKTAGIAIITSLIALAVTLPWVIGDSLLTTVAVIASLTAAYGDLQESRLKRLVDVQDSGEHLRQGRSIFAKIERAVGSHGGFLDRFDATFFCFAIILPVIAIFMVI